MKSIALILLSFFFFAGRGSEKLKKTSSMLHVSVYPNNGGADFSVRGKYVVIDYWATWCGPCVAGLAHFNELASHYANNDNVIFGALTKENSDIITKFLDRRKNVKFVCKCLLDSCESSWLKLMSDVDHIPYCMIFAPDGGLVYEGSSNCLQTQMLDSIFNGQKYVVPTKDINKAEASIRGMLAKSDHFLLVSTDTSFHLPDGDMNVWSVNDTFINYKLPDVSVMDAIQILTGVSNARIAVTDTNKAKKRCILIAKVNKAIIGEHDGPLKEPGKNYVLHHIENVLHCSVHRRDTVREHYLLKATDMRLIREGHATLLEKARSCSRDGDQVTLANYNLRQVADVLEDILNIPVVCNDPGTEGFDWVFNTSNNKNLIESLKEQGLQLMPNEGSISILHVSFH